MKNNRSYSKVGRCRSLFVACAAAAGMSLSAPSLAQPVTININFDAGQCPTGVSSEPSVSRGQMITWQSVPEGIPFEIFFDPIQGQPLRAPRGNLQRPVNGGVPNADYKYTVVGTSCPDRPLDPNIRVY